MIRRAAGAVIVLLSLTGALASCGRGEVPASLLAAGEATVVRVVDGDTIVVRLASGQEKVRLLGIDTPEKNKPNSPVECYAQEASRRTEELLPPGTRVRLERDKEPRDRFGRLLAYVTRASDGVSIESTLLSEGFAATLSIRPNTTRESDFDRLAAEAKRAGRGLWSACGGPHVVR